MQQPAQTASRGGSVNQPTSVQQSAEYVLEKARWIEANHNRSGDGLCLWCMATWPCPYRVVADYALASIDGLEPA